MPRDPKHRRRVCFVTGTRAEFGLMQPVLRAIGAEPSLKLQLIATGMHLDPAHGKGLEAIRESGWKIDRVVPWPANSGEGRTTTSRNMGRAIAELADGFAELKSEVVLVVGDRVEAFAAAAAAHVGGQVLAHVHGGDRAAGQVDDSLRHAISKLAHVHFPATRQSADRLLRLGEQRWRVARSGSPGLDGIRRAAADFDAVRQLIPGLAKRRYALLVLHPADPDERLERQRAETVLDAIGSIGYPHVVIVYPNNDPGNAGIIRHWRRSERVPGVHCFEDLPRDLFLALMRDAAVLVGNSSSGIIEAASFGTPVLDIGPRQLGRERGPNIVHAAYDGDEIRRTLRRLWRGGKPIRYRSHNIYGGDSAGRRIARHLACVPLNERLKRKLIAY